jgi:hypothetical protein
MSKKTPQAAAKVTSTGAPRHNIPTVRHISFPTVSGW